MFNLIWRWYEKSLFEALDECEPNITRLSCNFPLHCPSYINRAWSLITRGPVASWIYPLVCQKTDLLSLNYLPAPLKTVSKEQFPQHGIQHLLWPIWDGFADSSFISATSQILNSTTTNNLLFQKTKAFSYFYAIVHNVPLGPLFLHLTTVLLRSLLRYLLGSLPRASPPLGQVHCNLPKVYSWQFLWQKRWYTACSLREEIIS